MKSNQILFDGVLEEIHISTPPAPKPGDGCMSAWSKCGNCGEGHTCYNIAYDENLEAHWKCRKCGWSMMIVKWIGQETVPYVQPLGVCERFLLTALMNDWRNKETG